ncbi:MAG: sigma-70 family RNA polymerase sigma factor [Caldisericia bacterium]|nr:sigma-70 family RNA polymerase sigma factor [Caldisericia bacterium]
MDKQEREDKILQHQWIVQYLANKLADRNTQLAEDLKSVGNIGLIKAVDNFDQNTGAAFTTYATVLIQGEMLHYLRDNSDIIRIPRKYTVYYKMIQEAVHELRNTSEKVPTIQQISDKTGLSKEIIIESFEAGLAKYPTSIEESLLNEEEKVLIKDTLSDPHDHVTTAIQRITLNTALMKLEAIERKSIVLKYSQDLTNQEIAEKLGVHTGKVNRSIKSGLDKLKKILERSGA